MHVYSTVQLQFHIYTLVNTCCTERAPVLHGVILHGYSHVCPHVAINGTGLAVICSFRIASLFCLSYSTLQMESI